MKKIFIAIFVFLCFSFSKDMTYASNQSPKTFLWIGTFRDRGGFTDQELDYIVKNYDLVLIINSHAQWNKTQQHEDVKKLKALKSDLPVLFYFPTSYRFNRAEYGVNEFKEEWYLHDNKGDRIPHQNNVGFYVDLSNKEYRDWVLNTIKQWMKEAPYDGMIFDNASPIAKVSDENLWRIPWQDLIDSNKIVQWNKGREKLLTQGQQLVAKLSKNSFTFFNGIARRDWIDNRNLATLEYFDGAVNEDFCYKTGRNGFNSKEETLEDIELMYTYPDKIFLQKVNHFNDIDDEFKQRLGRYCLGAFLLGDSGNDYFKIGPDYKTEDGEITQNADGIDIQLGQAITKYYQQNNLYVREFENGWVVVNFEDSKQNWITPDILFELNNGEQKRKKQDLEIPIGNHDSKIFLKINKSDVNKDGTVNFLDIDLLNQKYFNQNSFSKNNVYNIADLNQDDIINGLDAVIIIKEMYEQ